MFDALGGHQFIGDLADLRRRAAHHEHFETVVVVQVDMQRRDDDLVVIVLDVGEGGLDVLFVVVVNERDRAGDFFVAEFLAMLDQVVADHVRDGQRPVAVAFLGGHLVQVAQKLGR